MKYFVNPLSADPPPPHPKKKWSNTLKQFVDISIKLYTVALAFSMTSGKEDPLSINTKINLTEVISVISVMFYTSMRKKEIYQCVCSMLLKG